MIKKMKLLSVLLITSIFCSSCVMLPVQQVAQANAAGITTSANTGTFLKRAAIGVGIFAAVIAVLYGMLYIADAAFSPEPILFRPQEDVRKDLEQACKNGKLEDVEEILEYSNKLSGNLTHLYYNGIDKNGKRVSNHKFKPFIFACKKGNIEIVKLLMKEMEKGGKGFWDRVMGDEVLYAACKARNPEVFKLIVNEKIQDVNDTNNPDLIYNRAPLHVACECGRKDLAQWLIEEKGADPLVGNLGGGTPMYYACKSGNIELIKWLDENTGASINLQELDLNTLCACDNVAFIRWLIEEKGLDLKTKTYGHFMNIKSQGGDLDEHLYKYARDQKIGGFLLYSALAKGNIDLARYLRSRGVRYGGENALTYVKLGGVETLKFLSDIRVIRIHELKIPLLKIACEIKNLELLQYVVEACDITIEELNQKIEDETLLHIACDNIDDRLYEKENKKSRDVVKYLLEKGADVDVQDSRKRTPLHIACKNGKFSVVKMLVKKGASVTAKDVCENIPRGKSNSKIEKFLEKKR